MVTNVPNVFASSGTNPLDVDLSRDVDWNLGDLSFYAKVTCSNGFCSNGLWCLEDVIFFEDCLDGCLKLFLSISPTFI